MIISASRRTDIPAFYADWLVERVRQGYFYRVNPFNSRQITGFSLKPEDVDAICFWTKNPGPLMRHLDELDRRGLNYYFQFTLNPYDAIFEPQLPPIGQRIAVFRKLAGRIGPERVVWRYDPVILSSVTPVSWHLLQAQRLAAELAGSTRRLVFSFYDFYGQGQGRLHRALQDNGIGLEDFTEPEQREEREALARGFGELAARRGLQIYSCSEEADLTRFGIKPGACIDGDLIRRLFGVEAAFKSDRNQRAACNCVQSVDMGSYNSCRFRCAYCYANFNPGIIESNCERHYPDSPLLVGQHGGPVEIRTSPDRKKCGQCQPPLFDSGT